MSFIFTCKAPTGFAWYRVAFLVIVETLGDNSRGGGGPAGGGSPLNLCTNGSWRLADIKIPASFHLIVLLIGENTFFL